MDINADTLRALHTGVSLAFNERFSTVESYYTDVCMTVPSTTAMNEYPRMDDVPGFREWIGDRVVHDLSASTYIVRNREFEKTIGVRRSQIEDDQYGFLTSHAAQLGQDAAEFPDSLVWPLWKAGATTIGYDGQYYFDTDHLGYNEAGAEISVSNYQAGGGPAWYLIDDTKVMKPMVWQRRKPFALTAKDRANDDNVFMKGKFLWGVDGRCNAGFGLWQLAYMSKATLNAENYEAARIALSTLRRRDGTPLNIKGTKLIVPPQLEGAGLSLLQSQLINGGESNKWANSAKLLKVPWLA